MFFLDPHTDKGLYGNWLAPLRILYAPPSPDSGSEEGSVWGGDAGGGPETAPWLLKAEILISN